MAGEEAINVDINSRFNAAGITQAQKGIVDLNQSAAQIVASLRQAAAAAGQDETAFLGMAGAASQAALATGNAAKAEEILSVAMGKGGAAATQAGEAVAASGKKAQEAASYAQKFGESFQAGLVGIIGPAAAASAAIAGVVSVTKSFGDALSFKGELDATTAAIDTQLHGVRDAGQVWTQAAHYAEEYKLTQQETDQALVASVPVIRNTTASMEEVLGVFDRLRIRQPGKTFEDAARALGELQAGQVVSIEHMFNVPAADANRMKHEIEGGADAIQVLSKYLTDSGVGIDALAAKTEGVKGKMLDLARAQEQLKLAQAEFAQGPGMVVLEGQIRTITGATRALSLDFQSMAASIQDAVAGAGQSIGDMITSGGALGMAWRAVTGEAAANAAATQQAGAAAQQATGAFDEDRTAVAQLAATHAQATAAQIANANSMELAGVQARAAAVAAEQKSNADKVAALDAQTHAIAEDTLNKIAERTAQNLLKNGDAGAREAALLASSSSLIDQRTAAYYRLAAAMAAAGAGATQQQAADFRSMEVFGQTSAQRVAAIDKERAADQARSQGILQNGTAVQKVAELQRLYNDAVRQSGPASAQAITAQNALVAAQQEGASKRAGAAGAAATKLEGIEQKTGDKITQIVEDTQKKITAIDEREAAKQAAALRKLNEDIATLTADRRASNEADDLDLIGVKDAKEAARLNDRERAEAGARRREQQAESEARSQAEAGDAETAQKTLAIREKQINDQQALDEKYYARQRELAGDPANQEALKKQYDEATRANDEAAQARIDIAKQEADQKKAEVQAEKDAVIAAANDQANGVVSAAERSAQGVTKASATARAASVANLKAIGDAVTAIPSQKTITITVNQQGKVDASSVGGTGNKAAGGGTFVTSGKTNLTVGDNPGGQELVTVTPLSGRGTTSVGGNIARLAGGGVVLIDAGGGYTTPLAGAGGGGGSGGGGSGKKAPAAIDPKKALDEMKNTVQLLMDMAKLKEQIAALASVPAFDIPLVQALVDRAQQFTAYVAGHLVPITKAEGESLARYVTAATSAASVIKDLADLKKDIAELKNVPAFDQPIVLALIDRALQFTTAVQQRLIPLTEFEATQMSRYRGAVGDTVGILKDVADLKKTMAADTAPIVSDQSIIRLADQAARIATLVRTRILPSTKEEADGLSQYAGMVGSSVSILKDAADVGGKLFTDYTSPTDAQIGMLAADAKRVADGVMAAASSYSTDGLAAGKAYAEGVGATFTAFKDGLLFFDALKSGDFKLDTGALAAFETSTLATLDVAKRLGAVAATIPASDIAALGVTTRALSDQSEALIRLAAVPFGDLPGAAAGLAQSGAALLGGKGGATFYNTFQITGGDPNAIAQQVIQALNQQMGMRK